MKSRIQAAIALNVLSFPLLGLGLLDPLEGLPALILGLVALLSARVLSKLRVPKLAWISLMATMVLLAIALVIVSLELQAAQSSAIISEPTSTTVGNALAGPAGLVLWASRISLLTMLVGLGLYIRNLVRALKAVTKSEGSLNGKP